MESDNIVIAKNIMKTFPHGTFMRDRVKILNDVSFEVPKGENVAVIGPNGCGKTTLLKTLATIYLPDSGELIIDGYNIKTDIKKIRERVNIITPGLTFHNKLTLKETLKFFAGVLKVDLTEIYPLLERVGLEDKLNTRLEAFSESQKAFTRVAVGLMNNPKVLILDEISTALDAERKEKVIDILDEIDKERDLTMFIADHDMTVVDRLCHKIILMDQSGKIAKIGTMDDFFKFIPYKFDTSVVPRKPMDKKFWDSFGLPFETLGHQVRFFSQSKNEVMGLTDRLTENDEHILEFTTSGISLEDVYLFWLSTLKVE